MRAARILLVLALLGGGLGASLLFTTKALRSLRDSPYATQPRNAQPDPAAANQGTPQRRPRPISKATRRSGGKRHAASGARRDPAGRSGATARAEDKPRADKQSDEGEGGVVFGQDAMSLLLIAALEVAAAMVVVVALVVVLTVRRVRNRARRRYALYQVHLSAHDEAKPQDLEDMVESMANIVRAWPAERARNGQPFVAIELICGHGPSGMEWSINVRRQPEVVGALDAAISAAYPDVRLGRVHAERPVPRTGVLREPGHVLRFRKERSFVYPLIATDETLASPPLEQIALAQVSLSESSVVRFGLTPTPSFFEELARKLYKRHENKLMRQERWGLPQGGLWSTLNRAEMGNAQRTQNRSLFWLEVVVAADTAAACRPSPPRCSHAAARTDFTAGG